MQDLLLLCCNASNDTTRPGQRMKVQMGHFVISCDILCLFISRSHLGARNLCIFVLSNFGIVWIGQALRPKTQLCSVAQQATQCLRCLPGPSSACYSWESKSSCIECTCWNTGDCIGSCSSFDFWLSYSDYLRLSQTTFSFSQVVNSQCFWMRHAARVQISRGLPGGFCCRDRRQTGTFWARQPEGEKPNTHEIAYFCSTELVFFQKYKGHPQRIIGVY